MRRQSCCAAARATCRTISSRCCSARAAPEDLVGYDSRRARGARPRGLGVPRHPQAGRAEDPLRAAERLATASISRSISVIEIVNDDMPFLVDSVMAELTERGLAVRLVVASDLRGRARQGRQARRPRRARRGGRQGRARAKASSTSTSSASTTPRAAPRSCRRWSRCWPRCGAACRTGGRCSARRRRRSQELKANPPPVPVDEIAEAIQFLEWLAADNFTLLGVRDYTLAGKDARSRAGAGDRARRAARRRRAGAHARRPAGVDHAGAARLLRRAEDADRHQGQRQVARAPARLPRLHRRQALRRRRQPDRRIPHRRPVHLDRLHPLDPHDPLSAPQGRRGAARAPASIPTAIPARRWSTCWRPIRATSCSRSTRTRSITSR